MSNWQPIETAPKDRTKILVYTIHGDVEVSEWYESVWPEYEPAEGDLFRKVMKKHSEGWNSNWPTHWMPLPQAPADAEEVAAALREQWKRDEVAEPSRMDDD